ncbi:MAG: Re/Si-specific NAD(P)(+) transhydrogenase subunit alpha [Phycisphaerales bacterium]|nr:Re/Si-specific NAD(P)(+) transhydrogenase subunit alpha [Phycisphaerales bacterium]
MIVSAITETQLGERLVAVTPASATILAKLGVEVVAQAGCGIKSHLNDEAYQKAGVSVVADRRDIISRSNVLLQVHALGGEPLNQADDLAALKAGTIIIGFADPLTNPQLVRTLAGRKATLLAMELVPRITRAQNMDALSSLASIAGYRAVLLAAGRLGKIFPMMITPAGTITASRVFVIGAGVAGLQAIATARRLGAQVSAFDVRPAVKEQVQSLGAKFVELPLNTANAQTTGGYAREQTAEEIQQQRALMMHAVAGSDVVIATAAVPGKKAPILVTRDMVQAMSPGSVIVDLAAARGGNCELTRPDEVVDVGGVTILGPTNMVAEVPVHASQMYASNVANLLKHLVKDGNIALDMSDQITRDMLVLKDGETVNERVKSLIEAPAAGHGDK